LLPAKINPKDRRMLQASMSIPVLETNPENLPAILSKLEKLEICLLFSISNQQGDDNEEEVLLEVDSREYVKEIVSVWKKSSCPELYESYCNKIA